MHGHFLAALSSELFQKIGARAVGDEIATRRRLEQIGQRLVLCASDIGRVGAAKRSGRLPEALAGTTAAMVEHHRGAERQDR